MTNLASSIVVNVDSYKSSMSKQYPPGTKIVYSYITPRGPKEAKIVNLGLQVFLREVLSKKITKEEVEFAKYFWAAHGEPFPYNEWMYIVNELDGVLPLRVVGLDEGLVVPARTPVAAIWNTDPRCFWLTTWVETAMLRAIWYPSTIATKSKRIRDLIKSYLEKSGDVSGLPFKLHDFGARGVSSLESAMIGGMAHLATGAMGTDTVSGIFGANLWYDASINATGFSIPAAEHSTITSWGRDNESLAYENMIKQFSTPNSIYAVVSDSYDIFNAVENIWGVELKEKVVNSGGTLVIRPDSGDPLEVLPRLIHSLEKNFGAVKNDKGYKVLQNVRIIWGDGITFTTISGILRLIVDVMGYSADNIAFGMGGALLQIANRDDFQFAMKASAAKIGNTWVPVYKDPVTDSGKKSDFGIFTVNDDYSYTTGLDLGVDMGLLKTRYENGKLMNQITFEQVRANANLS